MNAGFFFGLICLFFAVFFPIFGRTLFIDLFTRKAKKLGMFWQDIALSVFILSFSSFLIYIGVHGILGKLIIKL